MANLIDTSYFIGDIEIPNVSQAPIKSDVENSIKLYEREVLIELMGYQMYKDFLAATPVPGDKWYKLINGAEVDIVVESETRKVFWEGLKGFEKRSLIAYYVYFQHRRKRQSLMSGNGTEVELDSENSSKTNLVDRLVYVWNEFVKMYGDSCIEDQHDNFDASAYNYILANKADFTNWLFTSQGGDINRLGI